MGEDEYGNRYYKNDQEIVLRDRWVEYKRWNPDATQIPSEWYGNGSQFPHKPLCNVIRNRHHWLHHITDDVPTAETVPKPFYAGKHVENLTGSEGAYKPYNTTVPKIDVWQPAVKERQG